MPVIHLDPRLPAESQGFAGDGCGEGGAHHVPAGHPAHHVLVFCTSPLGFSLLFSPLALTNEKRRTTYTRYLLHDEYAKRHPDAIAQTFGFWKEELVAGGSVVVVVRFFEVGDEFLGD